MMLFEKSLGMIRRKGLNHFLRTARYVATIKAMSLLGRLISHDAKNDGVKVCFRNFVEETNRKGGLRILELGPRNISHRHLFSGYSEYIGFDINPGNNVDVVGDIHRLSQYFPANHFDAVYSVSVFEHLAFPWLAFTEINKVLKTGGTVFTSTHPLFPPHALPWDFWRFTRSGFAGLLNRETGFEIIDWAEGLPCVTVPLVRDVELKLLHVGISYLQINVTARKIVNSQVNLQWALDATSLVSKTYPMENSESETMDLLEALGGRGTAKGKP